MYTGLFQIDSCLPFCMDSSKRSVFNDWPFLLFRKYPHPFLYQIKTQATVENSWECRLLVVVECPILKNDTDFPQERAQWVRSRIFYESLCGSIPSRLLFEERASRNASEAELLLRVLHNLSCPLAKPRLV